MKRVFMFLLIVGSMAVSCSDDFREMNVDQKLEARSDNGGGQNEPCKGDCPPDSD